MVFCHLNQSLPKNRSQTWYSCYEKDTSWKIGEFTKNFYGLSKARKSKQINEAIQQQNNRNTYNSWAWWFDSETNSRRVKLSYKTFKQTYRYDFKIFFNFLRLQQGQFRFFETILSKKQQLKYSCYVWRKKLIPGLEITVGHRKLTDSEVFLCDENFLLSETMTDSDTYEKEQVKTISSFNYVKHLIIIFSIFQWTFETGNYS